MCAVRQQEHNIDVCKYMIYMLLILHLKWVVNFKVGRYAVDTKGGNEKGGFPTLPKPTFDIS